MAYLTELQKIISEAKKSQPSPAEDYPRYRLHECRVKVALAMKSKQLIEIHQIPMTPEERYLQVCLVDSIEAFEANGDLLGIDVTCVKWLADKAIRKAARRSLDEL